MPSTSLSAWTFTNVGPLTTTYTAPASCSTVATHILLATVATFEDTNSTTLIPFLGICDNTSAYTATTGNCLPSGDKIDSNYATIDMANPTANQILNYYSPGLYCPSNYVTVGVASNNAGSITSSGAAFVPTTTFPQNFAIFNPVPNILLSALDAGETAVLCCPQSYQVDLYGDCYSPLPSRPIPSTVCYRELPEEDITTITSNVSLFGTSVTAGFLQEIGSVPITQTVTSTITVTDDDSYSIITLAPIVTLIHNAAEATATTSSSKSGSAGRVNVNNNLVLLLSCWFIGVTMRPLF